MRAHGTRSRSSDERDATNRQLAAVSAPVQRMLDLQRLAGNAAVARSVEAERHQHGPGCGHAAPTVQRREAPHEHGPGCGHGAVEDTGPTAQRSLLDAARNTPSTSLPGAFLAKAKPFFQNDRLSEGRVHDNPIAQRATAALGAEAMTVGKHIFLGPKAVGNTKTLAHEASHLDKNIRGIPETGNNHGAGLTVTDPGQGSERAADTDSDAFMSGAGTAPSVVAQRSAAGQPALDTGQPAAVQRLVGFEAEIDLPVQDREGKKLPGDTDLANSKKADFKVVSDSRRLPLREGQRKAEKYSNLEFVTGAVSVVGGQATRGVAKLQAMVDEIKRVRDGFYGAVHGTPLASMAVELDLVPDEDANRELGPKVAPENGYRERADRDGDGALFVHYSVGVPLAGMPMFFDHLRSEAAPSPMPAEKGRAWLRLEQASEFSDRIVAMYRNASGKRPAPADEGHDALNGYCQLLYTQVAAMADKFGGTGQVKNKTVVLSRSVLADVRGHLPDEQQQFLARHVSDIVDVLADIQEKTEGDTRDGQFNEPDFSEVPGYPKTTLMQYATSALNGSTPEGHERPPGQEQVFGGMREISPHSEQGEVMIPMEIRHFGKHLKTWDDLKSNLASIAGWAGQAYDHSRSAASRRRT
ncbi:MULTISPECIES: eCIS core domain-containing protein [unclassified Streptomyces]|uniref:eCIS core domain-containing protein n=1 Tax=unclassified Streptomyces TaxID=2593676 RepID=UPI003077D694